MRAIRIALALATAGCLSTAPATAQEEPQVFHAFSVATAYGTIVKAGERKVVVVGTVSGPMFIETDEGPADAGSVTCGAKVHIDRQSARQTAGGACVFTARDGAEAWGDWECAGYELVGCRGKLILNGGNGRFAGISGEGSMVWRPSVHEMRKQLDGTILDKVSGLIIWRDFKIAKK